MGPAAASGIVVPGVQFLAGDSAQFISVLKQRIDRTLQSLRSSRWQQPRGSLDHVERKRLRQNHTQ